MFDVGKCSITAYNPKINQNTLSENPALACFVPNKKCAFTLPVSLLVLVLKYGVSLNPESMKKRSEDQKNIKNSDVS
jgi:hypothetical protein